MNRQNHDVKKAIDQIDVPHEKLDQTIASAIQKANVNNKKPKRKYFPTIAAASFATFLLLGSAFVSPTMAKVLSSVPVLDSVFEFAGDRGLVIASLRGLSEEIEQTVTDKGISLTIKDVYYDGTRLSVSYIQESPHPKDHLGEFQLKVDGKEINFSDSRTGKLLSDTQYAGILNIDPVENLPDSFDLHMALNEIGDVAGSWDFEIPVTLSDEDVQTIQVNKKLVYQDTEMTVKDVKIGLAGIKLSVSITSPEAIDPTMVGDHILHFNLLNDTGEALTHLDSHGSGIVENGQNVMNMEYRYAPLEDASETLTVSPYLVPVNKGQSARIEHSLQTDQLPLTIDQGKMGKIIVQDLQYEEEKMLLYFDVASDFTYDGHFQFNTLWLEDAKGHNLAITGYPERVIGNTYVQEFKKTSKNEPLTLVSFEMPYLEVLKKLEVEIPLM
ncbi:DUF4179 domain-containing protein [Sporosarcina obsidiansis]|uniref:DUF4179 domain-containing protein n=1 Tax=Sporosarcina obsidiansis TaxID=2660748 RepID=UPI00129B6626|nr:DUF4179 domain-containing protein [Sporosarcina obsidiansis]